MNSQTVDFWKRWVLQKGRGGVMKRVYVHVWVSGGSGEYIYE